MHPHLKIMTQSFFSGKKKLGILGGGQLGKMLLQCTNTWDIHTCVLDPSPDSPCKNLCNAFELGSLTDFNTVYQFGKQVDVLTIEIENVNVEALRKLKAEGVQVHPDPEALALIQDKGLQKQFYQQHLLPTADFLLFENKAAIVAATQATLGAEKAILSFPFVQKARRAGYDGKGVQVINNESELPLLMDVPSVIEKKISLQTEIAIIVARNPNGEVKSYDAVQMDFHDGANLLDELLFPAELPETITLQAKHLAEKLITELGICGLLAVEFFIDTNGQLLINEVAPRPHNSGHQTIESAYTSQYEQHLRGILNLPLGATTIKIPSVMVNLLGEPGFSGPVIYEGLEECLAKEGVKVHIYGKKETRPMRKMGHVTIIHPQLTTAKKTALWVKQTLKVKA